LDVGLIAHYAMEENTSLVDSFTNEYHGAFAEGSPAVVVGKVDNGFSFSSFKRGVVAPNDDFNSLNAVTISAWIKIPLLDLGYWNWHTLHGRKGQIDLTVVGDGELSGKVLLRTYHQVGEDVVLGQTLSDVAISEDTWTFIVGQFNGDATTKVWINGVAQGTGAFGAPLTCADLTKNWLFGVSQNVMSIDGNEDYNSFLVGEIDECTIWSKYLTEAEILFLYNSGSGLRF
jgi:hypothetical protein